MKAKRENKLKIVRCAGDAEWNSSSAPAPKPKNFIAPITLVRDAAAREENKMKTSKSYRMKRSGGDDFRTAFRENFRPTAMGVIGALLCAISFLLLVFITAIYS